MLFLNSKLGIAIAAEYLPKNWETSVNLILSQIQQRVDGARQGRGEVETQAVNSLVLAGPCDLVQKCLNNPD